VSRKTGKTLGANSPVKRRIFLKVELPDSNWWSALWPDPAEVLAKLWVDLEQTFVNAAKEASHIFVAA
jgi:hypothetical protein